MKKEIQLYSLHEIFPVMKNKQNSHGLQIVKVLLWMPWHEQDGHLSIFFCFATSDLIGSYDLLYLQNMPISKAINILIIINEIYFTLWEINPFVNSAHKKAAKNHNFEIHSHFDNKEWGLFLMEKNISICNLSSKKCIKTFSQLSHLTTV